MYTICIYIMNLLPGSQVQDVVRLDFCSSHINLLLIIEIKLSKSTQISECRNSMQVIDY